MRLLDDHGLPNECFNLVKSETHFMDDFDRVESDLYSDSKIIMLLQRLI